MKPYVVGIDIGGTNTQMGIVDSRGNILARNAIKTGGHPEVTDFIDDLYVALMQIIEQNGMKDKIGAQ